MFVVSKCLIYVYMVILNEQFCQFMSMDFGRLYNNQATPGYSYMFCCIMLYKIASHSTHIAFSPVINKITFCLYNHLFFLFFSPLTLTKK